MKIENTIAVVTGSNRGIGLALAKALLEGGARRVYAAARNIETLPVELTKDSRVIPVRLDVTDAAQRAALAERAGDANLLVNNAGGLASFNLLESSAADVQRDLDVNFFGPLDLTRRFIPVLGRTEGSAIVNVLSVVSLAPMKALGGYSASKAAAFSSSQAVRAELGPKGIAVHAVFPGPVDTDMTKGMDLPKATPADVARAVLEGLAAGVLDIWPDPMSRDVGATWTRDPRAIERQFGAM